MLQDNCPRCGTRYVRDPPNNPQAPSRDHILPLSRGGKYSFMWGDVPNIEYMCAACNWFRAACGNCWGAVACVDVAVAASGLSRQVIYRRWKFGPLLEATKAADAKVKLRVRAKRPVPLAETRKKAAKEAVRIGMVVHHVGVDEFIWPADTPAKRVWNLVTLARGGYGAASGD